MSNCLLWCVLLLHDIDIFGILMVSGPNHIAPMVTITTTSTRNLCSIPRICFHHIVPSARSALFPTSIAAAVVAVKCSQNGSPASDEGSLKDILSGMVDERVEQLLNKEENRALLEGLEQASSRVENAKRQLAEIQKQEMEAKIMREYIDQLESRASEVPSFYI